MIALFSLLLLATMCAAAPQDLSGKMFTFSLKSNTSYVKLSSSKQNFSSLTVCHRSFTDLKRDHALFSLATQAHPNTVLVIWNEVHKDLRAVIKDKVTVYKGLAYKPNQWHSICTTWSAASGLVQVWFVGQPLVRKASVNGSSIASPLIVLGQDQDGFGGAFDSKQSFVGMMTDIHMWDYVLSPCELHKYMKELNFTPGNALNWRALEFEIVNRVLVEDKQVPCV